MKNTKPHQIDIENLQQWMLDKEILYAQSGDKKLTITTNGCFKLYHKKEIVWQGLQPFRAVENYNNI